MECLAGIPTWLAAAAITAILAAGGIGARIGYAVGVRETRAVFRMILDAFAPAKAERGGPSGKEGRP